VKRLSMRLIFHVDLDAFYTSVEELENPDLRGKPVIVGGHPDRRGVVASASYAARAFGVRSAMPTARALRRCPKAILLPPRFDLYRAYSRRVMDILRQTSPTLEPLSIDEAFLDMTDRLPPGASPPDAARALQTRIKTELGLSASIGVASNKLVAKIASDFDKPGGVTHVPPGTEAEFLAPLPVRALWGVGPKTAERLRAMGVQTIGELARLPEEVLVGQFGAHGAAMARHARGIDSRPVQTVRVVKSISQETTFHRDVDDPQILRATLQQMSHRLANSLQKKGVSARTVTLKLRYSDFSTHTRQLTLDAPIRDAETIYRRGVYLLREHWHASRPLRLIGLGVSHFVAGVEQKSLFVEGEDAG